ncbi:MAG TPA: phospholipase D-like domain-containing protein [Hanamia sp.]
MQSYFKHIGNQILDNTSTVSESLQIAVAWFTNDNIFNHLLELLKRQIKIELIIVNDSINNRDSGLDFNKFIALGGHFYFANSSSLMHHKFLIIDKQKVITGSYNWTYNAEYRNSENITISVDNSTIENFEKEFEKLKETASRQVDKISLTPKKAIEIDETKFIKSDLVYKSYSQQKSGDIKSSKITLEKAKQIKSDDFVLEQTISDIEKNNENSKYFYHVEDGQFSFDFNDTKLLGKESEIIKVGKWGNDEMDDEIYILFVEDFYVECIGNIERSFPKTKDEHNETKKAMMKLYADD